jgi:hypothetical protein
MDPYLELHWRDVHSRLVSYSSDMLTEQLPGDLIARMEERIAIETDEELVKLVAPDVRVFERPGASGEGGTATASATLVDPILVRAQVEPMTERYVTIVEAVTDRLITVIEFISPTNKRHGEGLREYVSKRKKLIEAGVSLVEIDLIVEGDWMALTAPFFIAPQHRSTYRATVRRGDDPGELALYPISLRNPLPTVKIPLRASDPIVTLNLQSLIEQAYRNGRYDRTTDYSKPVPQPLPEEDLRWADTLLREAGRRK